MLSDEEKAIEELKNKKADYFMISNLTGKTLLNLIEKQSKEIEEYKKQLDLDNECEIALNSKVMDLEKEIEELKEDNKHQWEERCKLTFELENSTSNDKIKAKIEEVDIEIQCCEYADDDVEEYKQDMEKEKRRLLRDKEVLQSLIERE